MFRFFIKFIIAFVLLTMACAIAWEAFVDNHLYRCTDDQLFPDYFSPGDWVHGGTIKVVPQVAQDPEVSGPDQLKEGWTVERLWYLWSGMVALSLIVSAILARLRWTPRRSHEL